MQKVRPKKYLGQHFLTDLNIAEKIAGALEGDNFGTLIEIGPGTGVLTRYLLEREVNFKAIELDKESVVYLKEQYPNHDFVIEGDFLKVDLVGFDPPVAIIGNFPYNISSQIFFKVLEQEHRVPQVVGMIQKEVAERLAAPPGNKIYGILSVLLQAYYSIEYLFTVHEHCFQPPPKVKSAVIRLKHNGRTVLPCDKTFFKKVVKQAFNQRRKTLRNSLKSICSNLDCTSTVFNKRPEQLSVEEFIDLTCLIEQQVKKQK